MTDTFIFLDTISYERLFCLKQRFSSCCPYGTLFLPGHEPSRGEQAYGKTDLKRGVYLLSR
jgi:hypothetical protein